MLEGVYASRTYMLYAKSLITGRYEAFAADELLLPGEEPTQFDITP